jgi:hypothetical protein
MKSSIQERSRADELVQLTNFEWAVPKEGYRWVTGKRWVGKLVPSENRLAAAAEGTESFLIECPSEAATMNRPLHDALFREFAETPLTPEGVLGFANRHGWLGVAQLVGSEVFRDETHPPRERPVRLCERKDTWLAEIAAMYRLVRLWDSIAHGRRHAHNGAKRFEQRIAWIPDVEMRYEWVTDYENEREVIASRVLRPDLFERLQGLKNLKQVLPWYLQLAVNKKLHEHGVHVRLLWDRKFEHLGLAMVPTTLIGFLWLQFAKAIEGGTSYRQCKDCGKWFAFGAPSGRTDKRFCSGTCKARTHRRTRKRAGS